MGLSKKEIKKIIWDVLKELPKVFGFLLLYIAVARACLPEATAITSLL